MSRKRSINDLINLRIRAAKRADNTGSQLAASAAKLAERYAGNLTQTKSYKRGMDASISKLFKDGAEGSVDRHIARANKLYERKYSQNSYKGLTKG